MALLLYTTGLLHFRQSAILTTFFGIFVLPFSTCMRRQFLGAALLLLAGCAPTVYYVRPPDWRTPEKQDSTIHYYAQYVKGWKFYVDPGHGGEDRFNHGPAYDVIEADINLRVGTIFADYLRKAGATVVISREKDTTVTLSDRPRLSNASGAQIFVSVHHNAVGSSQDKTTNFTSVWYHARETDPEYNACNQDIARYIQRDLAYAMGNPGSPSSFDGTMSDYMIYPNAGFAVLRLAEIPAVLIEGSFFSSQYEEQRLKREEFNTIEAWGAFKGISRYLKAGIPHISMLSDTVTALYRPTLVFRASDSSGINKRSLVATIDNVEIDAVLRQDSNLVYCTPPTDLSNGAHTISLVVRNGNGNASFPFKRPLFVRPPVDSILVTVTPQRLPPSSEAMAAVNVRAYDRKGSACSDGTELSLTATRGTIPASVKLSSGEAQTYFIPDTAVGISEVRASASGRSASATLTLTHGKEKFVTGVVISAADSMPIGNAMVITHRELPTPLSMPQSARTFSDGRYILYDTMMDSMTIEIGREGFFGVSAMCSVSGEVTQLRHALTPVAGGVLRGKTFVLDARLGGPASGTIAQQNGQFLRTSDVNLAIAKRLQQLLIGAGATVLQVRKFDFSLSESMRIKYALNALSGVYIDIGASDTSHRAEVFVDPTVVRKPTGSSLLWGISSMLHCDTSAVRSGQTPIFSAIPYDALSITLPVVTDTIFASPLVYAVNQCAWGIYRGLLKTYGYVEKAGSMIAMPAGSAPPYKKIVLDNSLTTVSNADGSYFFYAADGSKRVLRVLEE